MRKPIFGLSLCLLPELALATLLHQHASRLTAPKPTPFNGFTFSGYVDTSYNNLLRKNVFTSGTDDRVFDLEPNGLTLQQLAFTLAKDPPQGLGGLLNIVTGRDANKLAAYGWDPYFGSQTLALDFTQAYLQYASGRLTTLVGKFATLAGEETYDPTRDTNFSRSILDGYAEPSTHLGLRTKYNVNEKLYLIAGINNGWDTIRDFSREKTIELAVSYTLQPSFSLFVDLYHGGQRVQDQTATGPQGLRTLLDLVAVFNPTTKLSLIANYDYDVQTKAALPNGMNAKALWQGLAAYVNYHFSEKWTTSMRGELFYDQNGYRTGLRQNWREITLTLGFAPIKAIELRAETRHDVSNVNAFVNESGKHFNRQQQSYALEGLYKF